jgi:hypothetical protein
MDKKSGTSEASAGRLGQTVLPGGRVTASEQAGLYVVRVFGVGV